VLTLLLIRYESISIKEIVEEVLRKVNPTLLDVAKHPIGLESRVHHIIDLLNLETSKVRIVGIYGMGGIGKSTLAKAVYNTIHATFEGSSFLSNLKVSSEWRLSLVHLQEQLLNDILKTKVKIGNVDRGINIIEERIRRKKVLVILDDVDDFENLHMLVKKQWFAVGSRIIITTRDEHLLCQLGVDEKYKVEELNHRESLQLLSWHAFEKANPEVDYSGLSIEAVNYAGGIPSTLVVLGSFLKGRGIAEWKSELENFRRNSHVWIEKTTKNSSCSSTPAAVDASLMVQLLQRFDQLSQKLDEQKQLILEQRKYFDQQIAEVKKTVKEDVDSRTCLQMRSIVDHFNDLRSQRIHHPQTSTNWCTCSH
jgi:energy-coupling factor transporter ATP-binding protein EcfA2